jgi:hypothetical protein
MLHAVTDRPRPATPRLETLRGGRSLAVIARQIMMPAGQPASGQTVRNWELGANQPSTYSVLEQYARALGDEHVDEVLAMFPDLHPEGESELLTLMRHIADQVNRMDVAADARIALATKWTEALERIVARLEGIERRLPPPVPATPRMRPSGGTHSPARPAARNESKRVR